MQAVGRAGGKPDSPRVPSCSAAWPGPEGRHCCLQGSEWPPGDPRPPGWELCLPSSGSISHLGVGVKMNTEPCLPKTLPTFSLQLLRKKKKNPWGKNVLKPDLRDVAGSAGHGRSHRGRERIGRRVEIGQTSRPRPGPGHRHLEGTMMRGDTSGP